MMRSNSVKLASAMIVGGGLVVLLATFAFNGKPAVWLTLIGVTLSQSSLLYLMPSRRKVVAKQDVDSASREELEAWFAQQAEQLEAEEDRLQARQRALTEQSGRLQEFLEYPIAEAESHTNPDSQVKLSEEDHEVQKILEAEAERVYEKIRTNGYSKDGSIDTQLLRDEVVELIERIARVYNPGSANPLLETSFEQLARAASRICLHSLVLLEQLPLDVKTYNIRQIHDYIRKAVMSYGAYQTAAPWLKRLSRGAYVGKLVAGTNPVSLGAWWLASELGRRGAAKVVENVVDRQAVGALNDLVAIVGTEAANIYAPGYRQRDAGWVYGAEITELLHRFPVSRENLQAGLREVTELSLRSEYDRIYLYRCVADHRSAGLRIVDPAVLPRSDRESIAQRLESFFAESIHGVTKEELSEWQADVEERLDLKLNLRQSETQPAVGSSAVGSSAEATVRSVHAFLVSVAAADSRKVIQFLEAGTLLNNVPVERRAELLQELSNTENPQFEPPDIDPSAPVTSEYLNTLVSGTVKCSHIDENVERLLTETCCFFRRNRDEAATMLDEAFLKFVKSRCDDDVRVKDVPADTIRTLSEELDEGELVRAVYQDAAIETDSEQEITEAEGVMFVIGSDVSTRAILFQNDRVVWRSEPGVTFERRKGYVIDDCVVRGGIWSLGDAAASVVIPGRLTSGGYERGFASLLRLGGFAESSG